MQQSLSNAGLVLLSQRPRTGYYHVVPSIFEAIAYFAKS